MNDILKEILDSHGDPESPKNSKISHDIISKWMKEDDLNILGALYSLLTKDVYTKRIVPALSFDEYFSFFKRYYNRCIIENPVSEDIDSFLMSRYSAGTDLSLFIISIGNDESVSHDYINSIKSWLENLYINGDREIRMCLINSVFEHIFQNKKIAKLFRDWNAHPILGSAYKDAMYFAKRINHIR